MQKSFIRLSISKNITNAISFTQPLRRRQRLTNDRGKIFKFPLNCRINWAVDVLFPFARQAPLFIQDNLFNVRKGAISKRFSRSLIAGWFPLIRVSLIRPGQCTANHCCAPEKAIGTKGRTGATIKRGSTKKCGSPFKKRA